jgi:hypothetical protein
MENESQADSESPRIESIGDCLQRQMRELGTNDYWEAVFLYAKREAERNQSLSRAVLGFDLF